MATKSGLYKCSQCGHVDNWGPGWMWFGSYLLMEERPEDVPTLCSDKCRAAFDERRAKGDVQVPKAKPWGYTARIVGSRRGY